MLSWAFLFLLIAITAALLGFTGIAVAAAAAAKVIFIIFLIFFIISVFLHMFGANYESLAMLEWVLTFLIVSIIAGTLGFSRISFIAADIARITFYIFIVLFIISLVMNLLKRWR